MRKRWVVADKNKEENLGPDPGEFGPQKPENLQGSSWRGFSFLKCSVLQREAFF